MSNTPDVVEQRTPEVKAEADAGRQVRVDGHRGCRYRRAAPVPGSAPSGHGLSSQKRGNEHISALFENGVMVPMRGSVAAQCMMASSHPAVTIVSELSRMTSARDKLHSAVGGPGEAQVHLVAQQDDLRMRALRELREKPRNPRIGRGVVDQHHAHVGPQVREHAVDARAHVVRRVVHRDDDVDDEVPVARSCVVAARSVALEASPLRRFAPLPQGGRAPWGGPTALIVRIHKLDSQPRQREPPAQRSADS